MQVPGRLFISIFFFGLCAGSEAQIFRGSAEGLARSEYNIDGIFDSIFIFTVENTGKYIIAESPNGGNATFNWSYYNPETDKYIVIATITDTISKIDTITSNLGYQLIITEGALVDTFRCWIYIEDFSVDIISTINDTIANNDIRCGYIKNIEAVLDYDNYIYYDPESHQLVNYVPVPVIQWERDPIAAPLPYPANSLNVSVEDPFWKDTWYFISVKSNKTGLERKDSAFYPSIQPHAFFGDTINNETAEYITLIDPYNYPYYNRDSIRYKEIYGSGYESKSGPARFRFKNLSFNADEYTWIWGDSTKTSVTDTTSQIHKYDLPGTYDAFLIAKKNVDFLYDPCYDTFPKNGEVMQIVVDPTITMDTTNIPNVFTPGLEPYSYWRLPDDVSITDLEIAIYNRFGKKVYYFKGNIRDWIGWDGKNDGNGKYVTTGVYFFVVKTIKPLVDFESKELPEDLVLEKKGFIHVYNFEE